MNHISLNGKVTSIKRVEIKSGVWFKLEIDTHLGQHEYFTKTADVRLLPTLNKVRPGDRIKFTYHITRPCKRILTEIRREY